MAAGQPHTVRARTTRRRDQRAADQAATAYAVTSDALTLAMTALGQASNVRGMVLSDRTSNGARFATVAQVEALTAAVAELRAAVEALKVPVIATGKAGKGSQ